MASHGGVATTRARGAHRAAERSRAERADFLAQNESSEPTQVCSPETAPKLGRYFPAEWIA